MSDTASPNADQVTYWNATAGNTWAALQKRLDRQIGPLGEKAIEALAPKAGEKILDIGCGCGHTTRELARRVGAAGSITAIDISKPMFDVARREAAVAGISNITFLEADAQTHSFEPNSFDALFSRFGVMFFVDPVAAFKNLRTALKAGSGRLTFVFWRKLAENEWMAAPLAAAMPHLPPQPPPDPLAPGPFAFADPDRVKRILTEAGFVDIAINPHDQQVALGRLDEAVEQSVRVGALSRLLTENPEAVDAVMETLRETLSGFDSGEGVHMGAGVWIVTARRA
ncbi:MAG: methyltransferase domain-containing protein [Beijerinckiaceae bacterium]